MFTPTQELPVAECGVLGVTAAPFVEGVLAVSAVLSEFILPRLALLSFQSEKTPFRNDAQRALSWLCQVHLFSIHPKAFLQLSEPHRQIYAVGLLR